MNLSYFFFFFFKVFNICLIFVGSWCKTIFNKQFKDQGNANCLGLNQPLVDITCKDGYGGSMCNVITALLCKFKNGQSILKECNTSKLEECTMKSTLSGNYYHCEPFTGKKS